MKEQARNERDWKLERQTKRERERSQHTESENIEMSKLFKAMLSQ